MSDAQNSIKYIYFFLVGLRYSPYFDFRETEKKKDKMIGKFSKILQNHCLACHLHKNLNGNHWITIDVLDRNSPPT